MSNTCESAAHLAHYPAQMQFLGDTNSMQVASTATVQDEAREHKPEARSEQYRAQPLRQARVHPMRPGAAHAQLHSWLHVPPAHPSLRGKSPAAHQPLQCIQQPMFPVRRRALSRLQVRLRRMLLNQQV